MHCRFCFCFFLTKVQKQWILSFGIPHYSHSNTISDTDLVLLGLEPVIIKSTEKAKKYNILAFLDKPLTQEKLKAALGLRKRK